MVQDVMGDQRTLQVSENNRFLQWSDGQPFFYLADTAWELFHRLTLAEAATYLKKRSFQGFTVIQCVLLAECDGLRVPNRNGDLPLIDLDPTKPNPAYFDHVEQVLVLAEKLGLVLAMLPTWGDKWNINTWGAGPEVFTPENAHAYGRWLGTRFSDRQIIWVMGGDRQLDTEIHKEINRQMALGLREIHRGTQLASFHPAGYAHSSTHLHNESWLDFNMIQSGHARNSPNWDLISLDYGLTPAKPCLDAEPGYEDHPDAFKIEQGFLGEWDCRKAAYHSVFSGALGHTYGCHAVWQFNQPAFPPINNPLKYWFDSLDLPGANQMVHVRRLIESRPILTRIPSQDILENVAGEGVHHVTACRCSTGKWAMIYLPTAQEVKVKTSLLSGTKINAWWFDPRTGVAESIGTFDKASLPGFTSPGMGPDWVLVLDDASAGFGRPGV